MVQRKYKVVGVNKCLNIYFFSSLWGVLHQQFVIRCWQIESGILGLLLCTNLCGSWKRACVQSDSVFSVALGCFFLTHTLSVITVYTIIILATPLWVGTLIWYRPFTAFRWERLLGLYAQCCLSECSLTLFTSVCRVLLALALENLLWNINMLKSFR